MKHLLSSIRSQISGYLRLSFDYFCYELEREIVKNDTVMHFSNKNDVAIALWFLATDADYQTTGHLFWVSKASLFDPKRGVLCYFLLKYIIVPVGSGLTNVIRKKGIS